MIANKPFLIKMACVLLFLNAFIVQSVFRAREFGTNDVDFQILIKLGLSVFSFAWSVYLYRIWARKILRLDNVFCILMLSWFIASSFYAPSVIYSLAAAFTFLSITLTLYMCAGILTTEQIIKTIIWGCSTVSIISLILYFAVPEFGRMKQWENGVLVEGSRLTGLTGTANAIGYVTAFACLLIISYRLYFVRNMPGIYYGLLAINLITQLLSNSRSSMVAVIIALSFTTLLRFTPLRLGAFFVGLASVMAFLYIIDLNALFASLSRTGDASEIFTVTGRTEIWDETMQMITQKPILGWGYASSGYYMPHFDHSSPHAHNMVLQIWFSSGLIGLILALLMLFFKTFYAIKIQDQFKTALMFFLLIHGLTEPSAFQGVASMATIVFALAAAAEYQKTTLLVRRPPLPPHISSDNNLNRESA